MKFYEKIIMIDSQSHDEREFILANDYITVPATISARKGINLGYIDTDSREYMTFKNSDISLSRYDSEDYDVFMLGKSDGKIRLDFSNLTINFVEDGYLNLKNLVVDNIEPWSGANSTLGTESTRGPEIGAKDIYSRNANITTTAHIATANITTAKIADKLEIKNKTVMIPADSSISDLRLPVVSHVEKGLEGGYSNSDCDFTVPTTSPGVYYKISIRSGNFRIPAGKTFYAVDYKKGVTNINSFIVLSPASAVGDIRGWVSSSDSDGFVVDLQRSAGEDLWGRYFHYSVGTSNTVA